MHHFGIFQAQEPAKNRQFLVHHFLYKSDDVSTKVDTAIKFVINLTKWKISLQNSNPTQDSKKSKTKQKFNLKAKQHKIDFISDNFLGKFNVWKKKLLIAITTTTTN